MLVAASGAVKGSGMSQTLAIFEARKIVRGVTITEGIGLSAARLLDTPALRARSLRRRPFIEPAKSAL
jgi:hypothetical protein